MPAIRPDVRERFRQVVDRAIARTDREQREHLEAMRPRQAARRRVKLRLGRGR